MLLVKVPLVHVQGNHVPTCEFHSHYATATITDK
jgi:hypothetical protein